jgi:hypothetical protein
VVLAGVVRGAVVRFRGRHKRWKRKRQRAIWKRGYYQHGKVRWYIRPGAVERDFGGPVEYHKTVEAFLATREGGS